MYIYSKSGVNVMNVILCNCTEYQQNKKVKVHTQSEMPQISPSENSNEISNFFMNCKQYSIGVFIIFW